MLPRPGPLRPPCVPPPLGFRKADVIREPPFYVLVLIIDPEGGPIGLGTKNDAALAPAARVPGVYLCDISCMQITCMVYMGLKFR